MSLIYLYDKIGLATGLCLLLFAPLTFAQDDGTASADWNFPEARQFDFWIGEWDVNLRMIQDDLTWVEKVKARTKIYRILDGKAILEFWNSKDIKGYSLRHYDSDKQKWILYLNWPGKNRSGTSSLEGSFRHGRGEFFSTRKNQEGKDVISRYTFSDISPTSLRWDDAFSSDGGKTWTNNWIMEFSRTKDRPDWPRPNEKAHTFETGQRCDMAEFRTFETLDGKWQGKLQVKDQNGNWTTSLASLNGYKVLDGCVVMNFMTYELDGKLQKSFSMKTYNTYANVFEDTRVDNHRRTAVTIFYGKKNDNTFELIEADRDQKKVVLKKYIWTFERPNEVGFEMFQSKDHKVTWEKVKAAIFSRLDW